MKNAILIIGLFFTTQLYAIENIIQPGGSVNIGGQTYTCSAVPVTELLPRCYVYRRFTESQIIQSNGDSKMYVETLAPSFAPILDEKKRDYTQKPKKLYAYPDAPYLHIQAGIRLTYEGIVEQAFYFEEPTNATKYLRTLLQQKKCKLPEEK